MLPRPMMKIKIMSNVDDFMNRLHAQASGGDDARKKQDRAIMRIFGSWIEKRTQEYLKATDNGESDAEYLGEKAKRACVDYETAREMARKILGKRYDQESIDECMMPEFDAAYEDADEEEWWRQKYFGNVG